MLKSQAGGKTYISITNQFHDPVSTVKCTEKRWKGFGTAQSLSQTG